MDGLRRVQHQDGPTQLAWCLSPQPPTKEGTLIRPTRNMTKAISMREPLLAHFAGPRRDAGIGAEHPAGKAGGGEGRHWGPTRANRPGVRSCGVRLIIPAPNAGPEADPGPRGRSLTDLYAAE
jgi:hypothetical protein